MSKAFVIVTLGLSLSFLMLFPANVIRGQEEFSRADGSEGPQYPIAAAVDGDAVYTVDLDLPGVWKTVDGRRTLFYAGSTYLRKEMNRPRPIVVHPDGGIIVGDSATREIYAIDADGRSATPLNNGYLGIPMALAVSPDGTMLYVGDAERRATFKLPIDPRAAIDGDQPDTTPELVARVNARGLSFDDDGNLYAVTPDAAALVRIDVETGEVTTVCGDRPFQYPGGLVWVGEYGYVSDVYAKAIWRVGAEGKPEKWLTDRRLKGPVLLTAGRGALWVPEPKSKQVFKVNLSDQSVTPVWGDIQ